MSSEDEAMVSDDDTGMQVDSDQDGSPPMPSSSSRGKGKAVDLSFKNGAVAGEQNLPWVEKYRPTTLEELVSHEDITMTSTGKTSTILACARKLYGPGYKSMILELNASDDRGIDVVREQIKNFASTRKIFSSGFKLIILDEADNMTNIAQAALRRVIEKYTKNVRFCIICNYSSKIIPAIQSRCTRFRFAPLTIDQIHLRLKHIIESENVNLTKDGEEALLRLSKGDMRRALNILQACQAAYDRIDQTAIYNCTGNPHPDDIQQIMMWMLTDEFTTAYNNIIALKADRGLALQDIITEVHTALDDTILPTNSKVFLLDKMAEVEYRLAMGATEKIQLSVLLGSFKLAMDLGVNNSSKE